MRKSVRVIDGVFYLDDKPFFLVSGDYPYYRDDPSNWDDRLGKIKASGIEAVSFYVPWRHHILIKDGRRLADFEGRTQSNRNVKLFIRLCRKKGLKIILKPGPFIHAETNFGGLPDWVSPQKDPEMEPFLDNKGNAIRWGKILPSPLSGKFKRYVQEWFSLVDENLLRGNVYPEGNIIAVQVCNEGVYSNAPAPINGYDYSASAMSLYRNWTGRKDQAVPRKVSAINEKSGLNMYLDWGRWQPEYMRRIYSEYARALKTKAPILININPPGKNKGLDSWLARVVPEKWREVNYGWTNWLKPVSEDISSFERYSLLAKRSRGVNLEGNWGFSKLYDECFKHPSVCVFEALLAVANGATGFNVYTAVNTACWDDSIDDKHKRPYPDSSPIREDGGLTRKYEVLKFLTSFFKANAADFLSSEPVKKIGWGFYPPYAYLAAWGITGDYWKKLCVKPIRCGFGALDVFHRTLRQKNIDYQILNIESVSSEELEKYERLVLCGGFFMDRKTQRKLSRYARLGGRLVFVGDSPSFDENFNRTGILKSRAVSIDGMDKFFGADGDSNTKLKVEDSEIQVWVYENLKKGVLFFFVLNLSDSNREGKFNYSGTDVRINLAGKGSAAVKVKASKLNSVFVKGVNEMTGSAVVPRVSFGNDELRIKAPCDLLAFRRKGGWRILTLPKEGI